MKQLSTRLVYENQWTRLREDQIEYPDGTQGVFAVVEKPLSAVIIPFTGDGFWMVEQYRYPVGGRYWEFPAGALETVDGASAEEIARAELQEETGLSAESITEIGWFWIAHGLCNHRAYVWLAEDLTPGPAHRSVEEQTMRVAHVNMKDFRSFMQAGQIADTITLAAYAQFLERSAASYKGSPHFE